MRLKERTTLLFRRAFYTIERNIMKVYVLTQIILKNNIYLLTRLWNWY